MINDTKTQELAKSAKGRGNICDRLWHLEPIQILSIVLQLMTFITGQLMRVAASQYTNVHLPLVCCDRNCLGSEVVLLLTEFIKHTLMYYYVHYVLNL